MRIATVEQRLESLLVVIAILSLPASSMAAEEEGDVLVSGGTFLMGTDIAAVQEMKDRYGIGFPGVFENEVPAHRVTVSDFRIDRHEVTNARYAAFLTENPEWMPGRLSPDKHNGDYLREWRDSQFPEGKSDHPVVNVTWHAAHSFCRSSGGRLPTEALARSRLAR